MHYMNYAVGKALLKTKCRIQRNFFLLSNSSVPKILFVCLFVCLLSGMVELLDDIKRRYKDVGCRMSS